MRRVFVLVGLVIIAFACSEQAGQMLVDAGEMMMPDAGAQPGAEVPCNLFRDFGSRRSFYARVAPGGPFDVYDGSVPATQIGEYRSRCSGQLPATLLADDGSYLVSCGSCTFDPDQVGELCSDDYDPGSRYIVR